MESNAGAASGVVEGGNRELVRPEIGEAVAVLRRAHVLIDLLATADLPPHPDATLTRTVFVGRGNHSLRCATDLALEDSYSQSITLARFAFEDALAAVWAPDHPKDAEVWLAGILRQPAPDRQPPRTKDMIRHVAKVRDGADADALRDVYGRLSEAAHPRGPGLALDIHFPAGESGGAHAVLGPSYNTTHCAQAIYIILTVTALVLGEGRRLSAETTPGGDLRREARDLHDALLAAERLLRPLALPTGG